MALPTLPQEILRYAMTPTEPVTGMELLMEVAGVLEAAAGACDDKADADRIAHLAGRVRTYLASSRPTTPLGMPRIASAPSRLADEMVVHRTTTAQTSHIRIVSD